MTIGEAFTIRFNALLRERGWTLHKFVKMSCVPRSTIVNICNGGTRSPTLAVVYQVADGFGMTCLEFLDDPVFRSAELDYL